VKKIADGQGKPKLWGNNVFRSVINVWLCTNVGAVREIGGWGSTISITCKPMWISQVPPYCHVSNYCREARAQIRDEVTKLYFTAGWHNSLNAHAVASASISFLIQCVASRLSPMRGRASILLQPSSAQRPQRDCITAEIDRGSID